MYVHYSNKVINILRVLSATPTAGLAPAPTKFSYYSCVCTHTVVSTKFTFRRHPCTALYVYTVYTCVQTHTAVDLCVLLYKVHTAVCITSSSPETGSRFTVPMVNFNCIL